MDQLTAEQIEAIKQKMMLEAMIAEQQDALGDGAQSIPGDELPSTMQTPSAMEKIANSLGRRQDAELYDPSHDFTKGSELTDSGTSVGDALYNALPNRASEKISNALSGARDMLNKPYQFSGAQFTEDGARLAKEGYDEGKPLKAAGGAVMAGMPLLGVGKVAGAVSKTPTRKIMTILGIPTAPLAAEEAFDPSSAYAAGDKSIYEESKDKIKQFAPNYTAAIAAALLPATLAKTLMKKESLNKQQEVADLRAVMRNKAEFEDDYAPRNLKARNDAYYDEYQEFKQREFDKVQPTVHANSNQKWLDDLYNETDNSEEFYRRNIDNAGAWAGAVGAGVNSYNEEDSSATQTIASALAGGLAGRYAPNLKGGSRTPVLKAKVKQANYQKAANDYEKYIDSFEPRPTRQRIADTIPDAKPGPNAKKDFKDMTSSEIAKLRNRDKGAFTQGYKDDHYNKLSKVRKKSKPKKPKDD